MLTKTRLIAGVALVASTSAAFGLGFGRTALTSSLGQPLSYAVTARLAPGEQLQPDCIRAEVVSGDQKLQPQLVRAALRGQTGEVNERAIVVSTSVVMDEPIVTVTVTLGCPAEMSRTFTALLDPPAVNLPPASSGSLAGAPFTPDAEAQRPAARVRPRTEPSARSEERPMARPPVPEPAPRRRPVASASVPAASEKSPAADPAVQPASSRPSRVATDSGSRLHLEGSRLEPRAATGAARAAIASASPSPARVASAPAVAPMASQAASAVAVPPLAASTALPSTVAASAVAASGPSAGASAASAVAAEALASAASAASGPSAGALSGAAAFAAAVAASDAAAAAVPVDPRLAAVEENLARLRSEGAENQKTLLAIQAQLRDAEASRYSNPVVYILALLCMLFALAVIWLLYLRFKDSQRAAWWASPEGEARHAAMLAMTSGRMPLDSRPPSKPSGLGAPESNFADAREVGVHTLPRVAATAPELARSTLGSGTTAAPAAAGSGPASTVAMFGAGAPPSAPREISVEELIDLEQQVDFFVILGQDEAAIDLLLGHLRGSGAGNPLPYLKLLDIYQRRGERDSYERVRERFNQRFNAVAPAFAQEQADERDLEGYPALLSRLQLLWPDASQALEVLEAAIFGPADGVARYALPAYRDLIFLYSLARDLAATGATERVDLLLPFEDDDEHIDTPSPMMNTMSVNADPAVQRPMEIDFDVSQPGGLDDVPGRPVR